MILRRFYDDKLAQASYMVGCAATGEAIIVDPNRDIEQYVAAAASEKLRITHVTETHIHADFVSGLRALAARTGAREYLSNEGGAEWRYAFAESDEAVLLHDGDAFMVGNIRFEAVHTPGHTPEHLSFFVTDTAGADRPMGLFTGDFIFVGDVGRPDLLERAAKLEGTARSAAKQLFASLQEIRAFPDYLQVWPGHGAGSACGRALGAVPQSTLGYEKLFNWAFQHTTEAVFVDEVLAGQPDPPKYFAEMKRVNREGPRVLGGLPEPQRLPAARLDAVLPLATVIDIRRAAEHADARVPGTINIPLNRSFTKWAGWLVPYDRDVYLLVDDAACPNCVNDAMRDLTMIGIDRVAGWFGKDAIETGAVDGRALETIGSATPAQASAWLATGDATVVDVREQNEWDEGHVPGATHIPLGHLTERVDEIPRDRPVVLHCEAGGRSAIAASVLRSKGFKDVSNLEGGYIAWRDQGFTVETQEPVETR